MLQINFLSNDLEGVTKILRRETMKQRVKESKVPFLLLVLHCATSSARTCGFRPCWQMPSVCHSLPHGPSSSLPAGASVSQSRKQLLQFWWESAYALRSPQMGFLSLHILGASFPNRHQHSLRCSGHSTVQIHFPVWLSKHFSFPHQKKKRKTSNPH